VRNRNLFLIGSGFTKAIFPTAPTNDELLESVVGNKPDDSSLGRVWKEYGLSDIELLLTQFDLDLISNRSKFSAKMRDEISEQLANFMKRFRFNRDVAWLHPFLNVVSKNDVIVSLSYDCFLEGFLDSHQRWSPKGGYHRVRNAFDDSMPENSDNIRILKVHGSESFRISPFYDKPQSHHLSFEINPGLFPRSAANSHLGGGVDSWPYLIAPSFVKQFVVELQYLMIDAIRFSRMAQNLIIIGCGLRPEDSHLWSIITNFLRSKNWRNKKTIIISRNADELGKRISDYWGRSIFNKGNLICLNSGFQESLSDLEKWAVA
jgi:hypothetical protein